MMVEGRQFAPNTLAIVAKITPAMRLRVVLAVAHDMFAAALGTASDSVARRQFELTLGSNRRISGGAHADGTSEFEHAIERLHPNFDFTDATRVFA